MLHLRQKGEKEMKKIWAAAISLGCVTCFLIACAGEKDTEERTTKQEIADSKSDSETSIGNSQPILTFFVTVRPIYNRPRDSFYEYEVLNGTGVTIELGEQKPHFDFMPDDPGYHLTLGPGETRPIKFRRWKYKIFDHSGNYPGNYPGEIQPPS